MSDLISREALLKKYCKEPAKGDCKNCDWFGDSWCRCKIFGVQIAEVPAVDAVEVVHAKWEWDENAMDWGLGGWICGKCHAKNDNIPAKPDVCPSAWVGSHFCPNCGARMDGE